MACCDEGHPAFYFAGNEALQAWLVGDIDDDGRLMLVTDADDEVLEDVPVDPPDLLPVIRQHFDSEGHCTVMVKRTGQKAVVVKVQD